MYYAVKMSPIPMVKSVSQTVGDEINKFIIFSNVLAYKTQRK